MPWPRTNGYGINENPITVSPYVQNNTNDNGAFSDLDFLLLDNTPFLLLDGTNFLLLGGS